MDIVANNMTIADYCQALQRHEIIVNRAYQRSDKVWPPAARSFLIETILLRFPMPKLSLHSVTDLRTRTTHKEIVDGQQRTEAIEAFFNNDLRLSTSIDLAEAAGKRYDQLTPDLQASFLDYRLSIDELVGAGPEQVREVFRRINSYTVPLNPEEARHASHQGPFKWFVNRLARDYGGAFLSVGVFREQQLVRMADAKLMTEVFHAIANGITTTNKRKLDQLYTSRDSDFPEEGEYDRRFRDAMDVVMVLDETHHTELMKPHQMYALLLAVMHRLQPIDRLASVIPAATPGSIDRTTAVTALTLLADALDTDLEEASKGPFGEFVKASSSKTNVAGQRTTRLRWLYGALIGKLPV